MLSTHDLTQFALSTLKWRNGHPERQNAHHRVYLVGVSMGGHVAGRSVKEFPHFYDGALSMCGVLGDNELFDVFFDENLVAQALAGVDAYPPPADYFAAVVLGIDGIQARLGLTGLAPLGPDTRNAFGKQFRPIIVNRSGGPRPGADNSFAFWKDFMFALWTPDNGGTLAQNPGRVGTNVGTVYSPNTPVDVSAIVTRVPPADPKSRDAHNLTQSPQIFGKPKIPVLTLHDLGDLFVPFSMDQIYTRDVASNNQSDLLVQRAIRATSHCEFDAEEVGTAFDDLVTWVTIGVKPQGDKVSDPVAVADPNFGCAFSDPAAAGTGTRVFFPTCS